VASSGNSVHGAQYPGGFALCGIGRRHYADDPGQPNVESADPGVGERSSPLEIGPLFCKVAEPGARDLPAKISLDISEAFL
jgi:hypothetical protein